jgi:hypothetical protein
MHKFRESTFILTFLGVFLLMLVLAPSEAKASTTVQAICQQVVDHKVAQAGAMAGELNRYEQLEGKQIFCEANIVVVGRTDVTSNLVLFLYHEETEKYDSWLITSRVLPTFI